MRICSSIERTSLAHILAPPFSKRTEQRSALKKHKRAFFHSRKKYTHLSHFHLFKKVTPKQLLKLVISWAKLDSYLSILLLDRIVIERSREIARKMCSFTVDKDKKYIFNIIPKKEEFEAYLQNKKPKLAQHSE